MFCVFYFLSLLVSFVILQAMQDMSALLLHRDTANKLCKVLKITSGLRWRQFLTDKKKNSAHVTDWPARNGVSKECTHHGPNIICSLHLHFSVAKEWSTSQWETCCEHVPSSCPSWPSTFLRANWSMSQFHRAKNVHHFLIMSYIKKAMHFIAFHCISIAMLVYWMVTHEVIKGRVTTPGLTL